MMKTETTTTHECQVLQHVAWRSWPLEVHRLWPRSLIVRKPQGPERCPCPHPRGFSCNLHRRAVCPSGRWLTFVSCLKPLLLRSIPWQVDVQVPLKIWLEPKDTFQSTLHAPPPSPESKHGPYVQLDFVPRKTLPCILVYGTNIKLILYTQIVEHRWGAMFKLEDFCLSHKGRG